MRNGTAILPAIVILVLLSSTSPANVAPLFTSMPDIVLSDVEQNTSATDNNFFVFTDALDIDEHVVTQTTVPSNLRWSFIETTPGNSIEINGIGSNTSGNTREPGPFDFRAAGRYASFRNVQWSPAGQSPPFQPTGADRMESILEVFVSDGTSTDSQTITVLTLDDDDEPYNDGPADRLVHRPEAAYTFDQDTEGWQWFASPQFAEPLRTPETSGCLTMTLPPGEAEIVFGGWESPKNPALAAQPRLGCLLRARYRLRSSVDGATCPGMRMRAITTPVTKQRDLDMWIPDFRSLDFNADLTVNFFTPDFLHIDGREPGTMGSDYDIISWPRQTTSLMTTEVVTYFACDLLDLYGSFDDDAGSIFIDQVNIDEIDNPEPGKGREETALTFQGFSRWTTGAKPLGDAAHLPSVERTDSSIAITVEHSDQWFEAWALSPDARLEPVRYYRCVFTVSSTAVTGGSEFGPTIRAGLVSSRFVWSADKTLMGGGLLSAIGGFPEPFEFWAQAPSPVPGSALTEPIQLRLESWLYDNNSGFPFYKDVSGTLRCTAVFTESFPPF